MDNLFLYICPWSFTRTPLLNMNFIASFYFTTEAKQIYREACTRPPSDGLVRVLHSPLEAYYMGKDLTKWGKVVK